MKTKLSASARWAQVIRRHESSGLSVAEFCRREDLSPPSFYAWRRRPTTAPAFVELKVESQAAPAIELLVADGRSRVLVRRGFDRDLLRELLEALGPPVPGANPIYRRAALSVSVGVHEDK